MTDIPRRRAAARTFIDRYEDDLVEAGQRLLDAREARKAVVRRILTGDVKPKDDGTLPGLFRRT